MKNIIANFASEINSTKNNKDILDIYEGFLALYLNTDFRNYIFVVGTNDFVGVQSSKNIKTLIKKRYFYENKKEIFTIDLLNSYEHFLILSSNFKESFGIHLSLFLDTNMAGIFSKFITSSGKQSHELVEKVATNSYVDLNFLFYLFENIYNPNKKDVNEKAYEILDNLCQFNSLYKDEYIKNKTLKHNEQYYLQMRDYLFNNFDEKTLAEYNFIYAYLIYAFVEKNSSTFDIKKSTLNILQIMQENGTNYSELFEFVYSYFKNSNNTFFNAVKTQTYKEIKKSLKNMSWDIYFYYSIRYQMMYFSEDADFGFPIFVTMDKKFIENYANLFENQILAIKDNKLEYCIRKPSKNTQEIQEFCKDINDNFQRNKLGDSTSRYILSQQMVSNAEFCLRNFLVDKKNK